jgi:fatty-acyl-CoA synthase
VSARLSGGVPLAVVDHLSAHGPRPCLYFEGGVLTYQEVLEAIYRMARALFAAGVQPGSTVAILAGNTPDMFCARTAAQLLGTRTVVLHTLAAPDEHAYILRDAQAGTVIFDPDHAEQVAAAGSQVPLRLLACLGTGPPGFDLLGEASRQAPGPPPTGPLQAPHSLVYSGGTTGHPKGIVMSPAAQAFAAAAIRDHWQWPGEIRLLLSTPLGHAAGTLLPPVFARGGSVVLMRNFTAGAWLGALQEHRATAALVVPTQLYRILDEPGLDQADLSSIETIFYGAAPCSPVRLAQAIGRFGRVFFQFYGQTEAPMTVCLLRKEEHDPSVAGRLSSCGRPAPGVEVELLGDDGRRAGDGEAGEICVRGPLVALEEYLHHPAETAAALHDGWLHTGDVASRDGDGFLHIIDRKKDMIVSGGFNVYPRHVEDCLSCHPAVRQVIVIGVPDDQWGEAVKAVVVLRPGYAGTAERALVQYVRAALGPLHAPKSVDFVEAIPLGPLGKPDRKALRARHWGDRARLVN